MMTKSKRFVKSSMILAGIACFALIAGQTNVYAASPASAAGSHDGKTITVAQNGFGDYTTISAAVQAAQPGDTVLVSGGTYRETVTFPRGGNSESSRITLKAADGQTVVVKGSDLATGWEPYDSNLYRLIKPNSYFGKFNPFAKTWPTRPLISCGDVYMNGEELSQQQSTTDVKGKTNSWYATVDAANTTIYANFGGLNPNTNQTEIFHRKQVINAAWNLGYITIDGLTVMHGCAPKGQGFWKPANITNMSIPLCGAISTSGGHHWIIQNCTVKNNRGVAIDYGLGSKPLENTMGGEPKVFGYHKILNNVVRDNGTNGIMAYKGPYTEIAGNQLVNNNALNTKLLSEGYVKDVDGGEGTYIHNNYFFSNQAWQSPAIWLDSECNNCRVSGNVFAGSGLSYVMYEADHGYNLMDNNVFIGVGIDLIESSHTYMVHNLFLNMGSNNHFIDMKRIVWKDKAPCEGWDGVSRTMDLKVPGTLISLARYETKYRYNKMINNIFYTQGLKADGSEPSTFDCAWPEYQANTKVLKGTFLWGNECDYNVYYNGAEKINNFSSQNTPDAHSAVISGNDYSAVCDDHSCKITINVDSKNTPQNLGAPKITGAFLGPNLLYWQHGYCVYAPDVATDFYGKARRGNVVGPFAELHAGSNELQLWPLKIQ